MSVELLHYTRGKYVENIHRGDAVCVGVDGNIIDMYYFANVFFTHVLSLL